MTKPTRAQRRQMARDAAKVARSRVRLAAMEPGGAPDRPIEVASASTVEVHAASMACAACSAPGVRVEEHTAEALTVNGEERRLRVAHVACQRCGHRRPVYFRLGTMLPS